MTTWGGSDPLTRRLRLAAFLVLATLTSAAVMFDRDVQLVGVLLGALLIDLGFEVGVRVPSFRKAEREEVDE